MPGDIQSRKGRDLRDDVAHDAVLDELRDGVVREGGAQALVLLCMCAAIIRARVGTPQRLSEPQVSGSFERTVR